MDRDRLPAATSFDKVASFLVAFLLLVAWHLLLLAWHLFLIASLLLLVRHLLLEAMHLFLVASLAPSSDARSP